MLVATTASRCPHSKNRLCRYSIGWVSKSAGCRRFRAHDEIVYSRPIMRRDEPLQLTPCVVLEDRSRVGDSDFKAEETIEGGRGCGAERRRRHPGVIGCERLMPLHGINDFLNNLLLVER